MGARYVRFFQRSQGGKTIALYFRGQFPPWGMRTMKSTKFAVMASFVLAVLAGLTAPSPAWATTSDYYLQLDGIKGESTDSSHKDFIEIDTFHGQVTLADITLTGPYPVGPFTTIAFQAPDPNATPSLYGVTLHDANLDSLILAFPVVSLVGYTGGPLCGVNSGSCLVTPPNGTLAFQLTSELFLAGNPNPVDIFSTGSVTQVPEPPVSALLGTGLVALMAMTRLWKRPA
jgi:hypothetical protein